MALNAIIMLMGITIAVVPFLGFPVSWLHVLFPIFGVIVIILGILVRRRGDRIHIENRIVTNEFIESTPRETEYR